MQSLKKSKNLLKMVHINACFLNKNFDNFEYLLKSTNDYYGIVAISETRIMTNIEITKGFNNIKNYNLEYI